jgi:peptidoglycan/LPS O-acetylase OafA/YrhL
VPVIEPKLQFAATLRGVAALCVLAGHFIMIVWNAIPVEREVLGQFGVGLFFLISGFVIPMSLVRYDVGAFLAARALRIYPTYAAAFTITLTLIMWYGKHNVSVGQVLSNYFLVRDLFGHEFLDGVAWTLEIEIKFYIICALLAPWLRRRAVGVLCR